MPVVEPLADREHRTRLAETDDIHRQRRIDRIQNLIGLAGIVLVHHEAARQLQPSPRHHLGHRDGDGGTGSTRDRGPLQSQPSQSPRRVGNRRLERQPKLPTLLYPPVLGRTEAPHDSGNGDPWAQSRTVG